MYKRQELNFDPTDLFREKVHPQIYAFADRRARPLGEFGKISPIILKDSVGQQVCIFHNGGGIYTQYAPAVGADILQPVFFLIIN